MKRRKQNPRQWSELPQDLLFTIADKLISDQISIRTFRSVCHSWRTSHPLPPPLPNSSILSPSLPLSIPSPLSVTIIYALHRPQEEDTWIMFVDEFIPGKLSIRKPFTTSSYFTPINFPAINLIDFKPRELGRFHNLSEITRCGSRPGYLYNKPSFNPAEMVKKVVLFPNGSAAIVLRDDGTLWMHKLNNLRVGINGGIVEYECIHGGRGFNFDDIVEYKGRILGIDRRGKVYEIEYYHSSVNTSFIAPISGGGGRRKRLVESLGGLYLVVRCKEALGKFDKRPKFNVYELNEGRKKWIEITSLGDRSFLFGPNFSFSASVAELGTDVKNSILFTMDSFRSYRGYDDVYEEFSNPKYSDLNIGVWRLDNTHRFGYSVELDPDDSDSFWPPPRWIWNVNRLTRIGVVETAIKEMRSRVVASLKNYKRDRKSLWDLGGSLTAGEKVLNLQKMVIRYYEEGETKLEHEDQESEDILNKEFLDIMSEVGRFFQQTSTPSHGTNEARLGRHAFLFQIEEQVTELKMTLDELLR